MGFWNSKRQKARKEHKCIYCGKTIEVGEEYSRETGTFEGEFTDYCLCLRCEFTIDKLENQGDYLSDFYTIVSDRDLIICPSCGTNNLSESTFSDDKMSCKCECDKCNEKWTADLSINGIKEVMSRW